MHSEGISGFESEDVLVTADFVQNMNDLFDVLNSRSRFAVGYKKAITVENFPARQPLFENVRDMFQSLTTTWKTSGKKNEPPIYTTGKIIHSPSRTGFLGLVGCTYVIEALIENQMKRFPKSFPKNLRTYKLNQDHLEIFFNALRSQNGWSYNPTGIQVRSGIKKLIVYAGNGILASASANCTAQDGTSILKLDLSKCKKSETLKVSAAMSDHGYGSILDVDLQMHGCKLADCVFCRGTLAYICGFIVLSLEKMLKCKDCILALEHSLEDPCNDLSLITMKRYKESVDFEKPKKGLRDPSGSVFKLVMLAEDMLRKHKRLITEKTAVLEFIKITFSESRFFRSEFFPTLKQHFLATSDGIDNHYFALSKLILQKFFNARVDKILRDAKSGDASRLHRLSILCDKNKAEKNKAEALALVQQKRNELRNNSNIDLQIDNEIDFGSSDI